MTDLKLLAKGALSEFMGVGMFVYIACGAAMTSKVDIVATAMAFGFTILVLAHIGHVSGGHINPAVTFSLVVTQQIPFLDAAVFASAQFLGAICGAALLHASLHHEFTGCLGANRIAPLSTVGEAFIVETLTTMILVITVYATIDPKNTNTKRMGVMPIGMAVMVCHLIAVCLSVFLHTSQAFSKHCGFQ